LGPGGTVVPLRSLKPGANSTLEALISLSSSCTRIPLGALNPRAGQPLVSLIALYPYAAAIPLRALNTGLQRTLVALRSLNSGSACIPLRTLNPRAYKPLVSLISLDPSRTTVSLRTLNAGLRRTLITLSALRACPASSLWALRPLCAYPRTLEALVALCAVRPRRACRPRAHCDPGSTSPSTATRDERPKGRRDISRDHEIQDLKKILTLDDAVSKDYTAVA
jgi:hypothetical protein